MWTKVQGYKLVDYQPVLRQQQESATGLKFPWTPQGQREKPIEGHTHDVTVSPPTVDLPNDVAPGESVTFKTSIKAPGSPGCFLFQWGMKREAVHDFGQRTSPVAVIIGSSQPQLDEARLSFFQSMNGLDADTSVEASLHDESKGLIASWQSSGKAFAAHSVTNWFQMSPGANLGRFAECRPRFMSFKITPKKSMVWDYAPYLLLNWTGGCSMFVWGMILTDKEPSATSSSHPGHTYRFQSA